VTDAPLAVDLARTIAARLLAALDRDALRFQPPFEDPQGGWSIKTTPLAALDCRLTVRPWPNHPFPLLRQAPVPLWVHLMLAPHAKARPWSPAVRLSLPLDPTGPLRDLVERLFLPPAPTLARVSPEDARRAAEILDTFLDGPQT
jgi:hypothetical protein